MSDLSKPPRVARHSPERPSIRHVSSSSTAYNGSQGHLESDATFDLERADYETVHMPSPPPSAVSRPALSSRLMSSFSTTGQPAAASALTRSKSIFHSRAKSLAAFVPKLSPNASNTSSAPSSPEKHPGAAQRLFADFFSGESAPLTLGFSPAASPQKEEESEYIMPYKPTLTSLPSSERRRSTAPQTPQKSKPWFSRQKTPSTPKPVAPEDDLANLDIMTHLFPSGPIDDLTPHAFNDLLLNATTLLDRMQAAYKEKVEYIASLRPEMEAQDEEMEGVETRSRHLKIQLEDMAFRAQEQDQAMRELGEQLVEERRRNKTRSTRPPLDAEEDMDVTPRRRPRNSDGSTSASDSGFESDYSRSGTMLSSITVPSVASSGDRGPRMANETSAWATVEALRAENRDLRARVNGMEGGLQGVIEFVERQGVVSC